MNSQQVNSDGNEAAWGLACNRGKFEMTVVTRARALEVGIPIHPDAQFVAEIRPVDLPTYDLSFLLLHDVQQFIRNMEPREVLAWGLDEQDLAILQAQLELTDQLTLH